MAEVPKLPPIDRSLVAALDKRFPEKSPEKGETYEDLMFRGGQRSVVRFLWEQLKQQEQNILEM